MRNKLYITPFITFTALLCSCPDSNQEAAPQEVGKGTLSEMVHPVLSGSNVYELGADIKVSVTYPASDWGIIEIVQKEILAGDRKPWHIRVNNEDFCLDRISRHSQWSPPASSMITEISREFVLNRDSSDQSLEWRQGEYRVAFVFKDITVFHSTEPEQQIHYDEWASNEISFRVIDQAEQDGADQPATAPESKPEGNEKLKPDAEGRSQ